MKLNAQYQSIKIRGKNDSNAKEIKMFPKVKPNAMVDSIRYGKYDSSPY